MSKEDREQELKFMKKHLAKLLHHAGLQRERYLGYINTDNLTEEGKRMSMEMFERKIELKPEFFIEESIYIYKRYKN